MAEAKRGLWSVLVDNLPRAVVAASHLSEARRIVAALIDHEHLPATGLSLTKCPSSLAARIRRRAKANGIGEGFLACLGERIFFTWIGGLAQQQGIILPMRAGDPESHASC